MIVISKGRAADLLMAICLLLTVLLSFSSTNIAHAYSVRYAAMNIFSGVADFMNEGLCPTKDASAHTMMPKKESFNTLALEVYRNAGYSKIAPIGGLARQAACLDQNCSWDFNHGLYYHNELTFFWGVILKGLDKTKDEPGVFNNFMRGSSPVAWYNRNNISFWGKRQPYMDNKGDWGNIEITHHFTEWICEYYEYDKSDSVFFPTFPNGDPIILSNNDSKVYYCGKLITIDREGRWIYQRCKDPGVWYVELGIALLITFVCFVLIVIIVLLIKCIRRRKKEQYIQKIMDSEVENPARIPTQSQINMSFFGSMHGSEMGDNQYNSGYF